MPGRDSKVSLYTPDQVHRWLHNNTDDKDNEDNTDNIDNTDNTDSTDSTDSTDNTDSTDIRLKDEVIKENSVITSRSNPPK